MKATITPALPAVTQTIVVSPAVPEKVTLEMTLEEAQFLSNVLSNVVGCPRTSQRRHAESVYRRLSDADIRFEHGWADFHKFPSIYFKA